MERSCHKLSPLHRAVVNNDSEALALHSEKTEFLLARDPLGFTALELALLLNRRECAKILDGNRRKLKIKVQFKGEAEPQLFTRLQFFKEFDCEYLPVAAFSDYRQLAAIVARCPWHLRNFLGKEPRAEGGLYQKEIWSGALAEMEIRWIDPIIGYGLFAGADIDAGAFIGLYTGKVRRIKRKEAQTHTYCFGYPTKWCSLGTFAVDSLEGGNPLRFANHSDIPNMAARCLCDRALQHIALFAMEPIPQGTQLTFNYGSNYWEQRTRPKSF